MESFFHDFQPPLTLPCRSIISVTTFSSKKMLELVLVPTGIKVQVPPGGSSLPSVCLAAKITLKHPGWTRGTRGEPGAPETFPGGPGDEQDEASSRRGLFPLISAFDFFFPRFINRSCESFPPQPGDGEQVFSGGQKRKGWVSMATAFPDEGCCHL